MARNRLISTSDFYCTKCGNKGIPIPRKVGAQREPGHLKKLYCLHCKKETNHAEVKGKYTYEMFKEEFELGRFIDGNKIPTGELMYCSKKDCEYNQQKRCWNSNYSFDCPYRIKKEVE